MKIVLINFINHFTTFHCFLQLFLQNKPTSPSNPDKVIGTMQLLQDSSGKKYIKYKGEIPDCEMKNYVDYLFRSCDSIKVINRYHENCTEDTIVISPLDKIRHKIKSI